MLRNLSLCRKGFSSVYYPLIISPNYEPAQYSPAYLSEAATLQATTPNIHQISPDRLPSFLRQQIEDDRLQFLKTKEILMIGRSNVGKSSLLNSLLSQKVSRTAKSSGTTKFLHFHEFKIKGSMGMMVDAPGYGFAAMNKRRRELWFGLVDEYLKISSRVCQIFHVINFEHGLKEADTLALSRMSAYNVGVQLVFNKVDKVNPKRFMAQVKAINQGIRRLNLPNVNNRIIACSTKTHFGIDTLKCRLVEVMAHAPQRNIDNHEHLLLEYLKDMRVSPLEIKEKQKSLTRPHVVRKLIYNSKLTKFLA